MRQRIGTLQICTMIILFQIGSTPLFELGIEAKQDSWLAMAVAASLGMGMIWVYLRLQQRAPQADLTGLYKLHFGRWAGGLLGVVQGLFFAYESMRNVRDFGELTTLTLLEQTPQWIVMLVIFGISVYTVWQGVEVFFRASILIIPFVMLSYFVLIVLLFAAEIPKLSLLRPVLEEGLQPIWGAFPNVLVFPFSQMVLFLMFWKYAASPAKAYRVTYASYAIVATFLIGINALIISVLGPEVASVSALPMLEVVELIRLANFIERLDVIVTLLLFLGLYVKMTALYMGGVLAIRSACGISYRWCAALLGILIYGTSFLEPNNVAHIWIGLELTPRVTMSYQIVLPLLMLLSGIAWVKRKAEAAGLSGPAAKPSQK
ncbi:GerAB/ArcD/ProY family transporter [Paenibacillus beijingensis]|uniref:Uncharacterized protein n=1 Tax=Paenibacillus beijingensis TaxID=1126833 RepID=A0A0D5NMD8_9BACL|nr:GerAB/ArcD/ProY family transporter [Paenibacillus beijingensis]AJY76494.1 hypothetical protein VN24_20380 [Paenibacillus beijingensis]